MDSLYGKLFVLLHRLQPWCKRVPDITIEYPSNVSKGVAEQQTRFRNYHDFSAKPNQILAGISSRAIRTNCPRYPAAVQSPPPRKIPPRRFRPLGGPP